MILELFPTKVYKTFYPNTESLKPLFEKLKEVFDETVDHNNEYMREGTLCSYHVQSDLHLRYPEETKDIVEFVESAAREYWKECNYYEGLEPCVIQLWANTTPKGGWIDSHLHGPIPFTGVVYVDASPAQGNLVIENPMDMVLMAQPIQPADKYSMDKEIEVNTGDVVLFPGYIKHSVKPNTTNSDRLILGFNIGSRGKFWSGQWGSNDIT